jgi:hypothetical protein
LSELRHAEAIAPMLEDDRKLTWREKRKLRSQFKLFGRESVRHKLNHGGYGEGQRRDYALQWLREQEVEADRVTRRTLDAAVIAAAVAVISLLVMLGVIR